MFGFGKEKVLKKCPKCDSKLFYVTGAKPEVDQEQLAELEKTMEKKREVFGPEDKKYYCSTCDRFF